VEALAVTVSNAGPGTAENIAISLDGEGSGAFTLSTETIERIEPGKTAAFTVRPATGLGGGTYQATASVADPRGATRSFDISFAVSTTPLYGISLDVAGPHTFPPKMIGYTGTEPLTLTITNSGNEATGALAIALTGGQAASFQTSLESIANIAPGAEETFTVQPLTGLAEGTHAATVTVSGDHELTAELALGFTVMPQMTEIATVEDLAKIGVEYPADGNYLLAADLTLSNWMPLAAETAHPSTSVPTAPFTGLFDGGGHSIRINSYDPAVLNTEIKEDYYAMRHVYIGLFGCVQGGTVKNLAVDLGMPQEQELSNGSPGLGKIQYVGGVAGYAVDTVFENITITGDLNLTKNDGSSLYIGGITAYLEGGSITGSESSANLKGREPYHFDSGQSVIGGLAGRVEMASISESRVSGSISAYSDRGTAYAGGAAGRADDSLLSHIAVSAGIEASVSEYFGGMTTFSNFCYAGGITGTIGGDDRPCEIRQCVVTGDVTAVSYAPLVGGNGVYAGGIAGMTSGWSLPTLIIDCYSKGNVTAMTAPVFAGVHASFFAGGILGQAGGVTIQNSYAAGTITVNSNQAEGNFPHAGGIAAVLNGFVNNTIAIEGCAALSPQINWRLYTKDTRILKRIATEGQYPENTTLGNNIANRDMVINYEPSAQQAAKVSAIILDPGADTPDGADCDAKPAQSVFEGLGWNFGTVWKMGSDGYPALQWQ
jgi:hypothetical protein